MVRLIIQQAALPPGSIPGFSLRSTLQAFAAIVIAAAVVSCGAGSKSGHPASDAAARQAHEAYVAAINSNNLDSLMGMMTEDVVFLPPNEPALAGKAAVRPWGAEYLKAYRIHWDKTSLEFIVTGDWAIERYAYKSSETPKAGGPVVLDTGKGLNIYHHDADGKWRVARDAWNSDLPVPAK